MLFQVVNLKYRSNNRIIENLSFNLEKSQEITIIGRSGIGKSTLLKILAKFIQPISGDIYFKDKSIDEYHDAEYRKKVSYCIQNPTLFGDTVLENVQFPFEILNKDIDMNEIQTLLSKVDLNSNILKRKINQLSGGERQRIAIIRNLLMHPDVLLLDEASDGLDPKIKEHLRQLLDEVLVKNTAIISVTHDNDFINKNSQIINLNDYETIGGNNN